MKNKFTAITILSLSLLTGCGPSNEERFTKICVKDGNDQAKRQTCECIAKRIGEKVPADRYKKFVAALEESNKTKKTPANVDEIMNEETTKAVFTATMSCATSLIK